jgi:hypothetical protein
MRRLFGLFLLLATTASAAPVITSVSPTEGSEYGGTTVRIRGAGFKINAEVRVDGALPAAQSWLASSMELEILTAPHAPGMVSISIRQDDGEFTLPNAFTYEKDPFAMSPKSGPRTGGTLVTIKGEFAPTNYTVLFGGRAALRTWRVSDDTLLAVSPPQNGVLDAVRITLFEYDFGVSTNLFFTYEDAPERVLLPLLIGPVNGALGSRFVTELRGYNRSATQKAQIYGLTQFCICSPPQFPDPTLDHFDLDPREAMTPGEVVLNGDPGRFAFVPKDQIDHLWLNLKVRDTSRGGENFGTELPIVRDRDLFHDEPIIFNDVPTDMQFRNTLRIYADAAVKLTVTAHRLERLGIIDLLFSREITLPAPRNKFEPSYVQIGDLPAGVGPVRITITSPEPGQPGFYTAIWAFLSVTNNDTQLITTIRP